MDHRFLFTMNKNTLGNKKLLNQANKEQMNNEIEEIKMTITS